MRIFNRAIELNKYPCDLYTADIKNLNNEQTVFDVRQQNFEEYIKEFNMEESKFDIIHFIHSRDGSKGGGGGVWAAYRPPSEKPTIKIYHVKKKKKKKKTEIHAWVPKNIEIRGYQKPCEASTAEKFFHAMLLFGINLALLFSTTEILNDRK